MATSAAPRRGFPSARERSFRPAAPARPEAADQPHGAEFVCNSCEAFPPVSLWLVQGEPGEGPISVIICDDCRRMAASAVPFARSRRLAMRKRRLGIAG
ncbi:hypothetical protein OJF2_24950 [Aquisphaera giovannonii]|uniref:Uncharacterized protein n=1 Tax=Aquisphaera giovannonii TaxID=406548 RepID=A0A5B9W013_9BACT|nr:hypothetical protein OJF2_24950 [Aquisphaera giovannonii]